MAFLNHIILRQYWSVLHHLFFHSPGKVTYASTDTEAEAKTDVDKMKENFMEGASTTQNPYSTALFVLLPLTTTFNCISNLKIL